MTAKDLSPQLGISAASIATKTRRMGYAGIGQNGELPQDVIDYYLPNAGHQQSDVKEVATVEVMEVAAPEEIKPVIKAAPEKIEPKQTKQTKQTKVDKAETKPLPHVENSDPFDPGAWLFFHPAAQFLYVCILLSCGAYVFGSLAALVFPESLSPFTQWMFYAAGFLVEASGIMISRSYKHKDKWDDATTVWIFLIVLFSMELWVEYSYMFFSSPFSFSGLAIVILRPFGQLAYSYMYLNKSRS